MISREDMLELTGQMTFSRTPFVRTVGCYVDRDGDSDGSLNINLLKLSASERTKKLKLVKEIPFTATNVNLKKHGYTQSARKPGSMWQLLMAMNECGLKNNALMGIFYDVVMEHYRADREYAILVFYDRYDIPAKGSGRERQRESEKVFEYVIRAVCPLSGEYEPNKPACEFSFLALTDRSENLNHIDVFQADADKPHNKILKFLGISWQSLDFWMQRAAWIGKSGIRLCLYDIDYVGIFKRKPDL